MKINEKQLMDVVRRVLKEDMGMTRKLVSKGEYNGYAYGIVEIQMPFYRMYSETPQKWFCAYVVIPEGHPLYGMDYGDIYMKFRG